MRCICCGDVTKKFYPATRYECFLKYEPTPAELEKENPTEAEKLKIKEHSEHNKLCKKCYDKRTKFKPNKTHREMTNNKTYTCVGHCRRHGPIEGRESGQ